MALGPLSALCELCPRVTVCKGVSSEGPLPTLWLWTDLRADHGLASVCPCFARVIYILLELVAATLTLLFSPRYFSFSCAREIRCIGKFGRVITASFLFWKVGCGCVSNNIFVQPLLLPATSWSFVAAELSNMGATLRAPVPGLPAAAAAGGTNVRRSTIDLDPR